MSGAPKTPRLALGAKRNPFEGLEKIAGRNHPEKAIRDISEETRAAQQQLFRHLIIVSAEFLEKPGNDSIPQLDQAIRQQKLHFPDGQYFVMDEKGERLYMGMLGASFLQNLGSCTIEMSKSLLEKRERTGNLEERHRDLLPDLIDASQGTLIVETGAGADVERIGHLQKHADKTKATLLCHDVVPQAAKFVSQTSTTPYIVLPPGWLHLGLSSSKKPKIVCMKNVISSLAFSGLTDMMDVAHAMEAQKVSMTQSVGLAETSNVFPVNWEPNSDALLRYSIQRLLQHKEYGDLAENPQTMPIAVATITMQISTIYEALFYEMERMFLERYAREKGFPHAQTLRIHQEQEIPKEGAVAYLQEHALPLASQLFESGEFNTIIFTPGCTNFDTTDGVQDGSLKVRSTHHVMTLSKEKGMLPQIPSEKCTSFEIVPSSESLRTSVSEVLHFACVASSTEDVFRQFQNQKEDSMDTYRRATAFAKEEAHDFVFTKWGKRIPLIQTTDALCRKAGEQPLAEIFRQHLNLSLVR